MSGRRSTNADALAKTALTRSPVGERDLEARVLRLEENLVRADGVQQHEAAGRHEREGEKKDARVGAALGGLAGREPEREREPAGQAEDQEVRAVVLDVRVELLAEQQ